MAEPLDEVILDLNGLFVLAQVVLIDVAFAGDNAIVVGMAAAGLKEADRRGAIFYGIAVATVLRLAFSFLAVNLLTLIGLTLAGGLLLLWVAWKMLREILHSRTGGQGGGTANPAPKSLNTALMQIVLADISMSLDNVLAVAGTARDHLGAMVVGLILSIALMGFASSLIARLLQRYPVIVWFGLLIVTLVALSMIHQGSLEVIAHVASD